MHVFPPTFPEAEAAFDAVTCLPGAFSMFRTDPLCSVEATCEEEVKNPIKISESDAINMDPIKYLYISKVMNIKGRIKTDFFSKPTVGIVDRNLYELGEDRQI
jgi:hypothetical protein